MALKAETDNIRSDLNVFRIQITGDLMALKENMQFMLRLILQTHKPAPVNSMSFFTIPLLLSMLIEVCLIVVFIEMIW